MGLDMYLSAKRSFWYDEEPPKLEDMPEGFRVRGVFADAACWRKANHIHQWFVDNVQDGVDDCRPYEVSRDQLEALVDLCKEVLTDPSEAEDKLPTTDGFFFGSTDYEQWYKDNLQLTITQIEKVLASFNDNWSFEYQSSW